MQNLKEQNIEHIAKYFKFYLQFNNQYLKFRLPFKRITAKNFYEKHKNEINKMYNIFVKYNLDIENYIRFFVDVLDKHEKDVKTDFANNVTFEKYIDHLKLIEKQEKIYQYFIKSAKNIAKKTIELGYCSTKDFIRYLIANKKISEYYVTGQISLYYFAAIPNFKKLIPKLDQFAQAEFHKVYDRFEMYNAEIISAFMKKTNQKVNPIKFTDELIFKIKNSKNVKF